MRRSLRALGILAFVLAAACQTPPTERLRIVPQIDPIRPRRLAFSPTDGNRLLVMEANGLVEIWNISNPRNPELFSTMPARAIDAAFSPDGRFVATACLDGKVRYWRVDGHLEWVSQGGHSGRARTVAVTEKEIVSGGEDGAIRLWRLDGSALGEPLAGESGAVVSVAVSAKGEIAALAADDTVHHWKRGESGFEHTLLHQPAKPRDKVHFVTLARLDEAWGWDDSVTFLPSGDAVAAVLFDNSLRLWATDGTGRAVELNPHLKRPVRLLALSPKGDVLASAGFDGVVRWWSLDGSSTGRSLQASPDILYSVAISPDGDRIATTGRDNRLCVWNRNGKLAFEFPRRASEHRVVQIAVAPQTATLAAADNQGGVRLWNLNATSRGVPLRGSSESPGPLAFSADGLLAVAGPDRTVGMWDDNGAPRGEPVEIGTIVAALTFSPQGDVLAVGSDQFQLWKGAQRLWMESIRASDYIRTIAFAPDSEFSVTGSWLGEIEVWNPDGSTRAKRPKQGREIITSVAVAPDGEYAAVGVGGGSTLVQLFDPDLAPLGNPLEGHRDTVAALVFAGDGTLVSGGSEGVIRRWRLPSRTVESFEIGLPINQLGYWKDLLWAHASDDPQFLQYVQPPGGAVYFYDPRNQLVATVLLRPEAALAFTPDGWFSDTGWPSGGLRIYRDSGQALTAGEMAARRAPDRVLQALTNAAG